MKKAQVKMFETIATLFVFFILLMFGFMFYSRMQQASFYNKLEELRQLEIVKLAESVKNLPELECSTNAILQQDCFDIMKVRALSKFMNDPHNADTVTGIYFDKFGFSNISIEEIYPQNTAYPIYNKENDEMKKRGNNATTRAVFMPVALYNSTEKTTHFGLLVVRGYEYD